MHRPHYQVLLLTFLACLLPALACTIILPPPQPRVPPHLPQVQPMEVRSHRVSIDATGRTANVAVEATFYNPNSQRLEGTYIFPIPAEAAVASFSMTVNGKTLEAELLEAGKALKIYEDIVRRQKDPALLEYLDHGLLKARVFPIEPRSEVTISLTYDQAIPADGKLARLRYPLLSAKPGGDGRIDTVSVDVTFRTDHPLKTLYTPGFDSEVKRSERGGRVSWEASDWRPQQDFTVVFSTGTSRVGVDMLTYKKGDDGYFLLFLAPNSELQAEEIVAKDITFVVDTSGSMNGQKIRQVKEALRFCVNNLNDTDRFNIVSFATDVLPFAEQAVPATEKQVQEALRFINDLNARGGTAIDAALTFATQTESREDAVPLMVFLTDGLPTIGEVEPEAILGRLEKGTRQRVFTFGVGDDVNTKLLGLLADQSRGFTTYVRPGENLELALSSFYEKVASPVMTDLELASGDVRLSQPVPRELPDLFKGSQLVVAGRYEGSGERAMVLSGLIGETRERFRFTTDLDGDPKNAFIPRLWAMRRVGFLQAQLQLHGYEKELVDEIKILGREYGILTPYTSFLVVEEGLAVEEREAARGAFRELESKQRSMEPTGSAAVDAAQSADQMRLGLSPGFSRQRRVNSRPSVPETVLAPRQVEKLVLQAADKTFYLRRSDNFYYDSSIEAGSSPKIDEEVRLWSERFFELMRQHPQLRQYVQAAEKLVLELGDTVYRFSP